MKTMEAGWRVKDDAENALVKAAEAVQIHQSELLIRQRSIITVSVPFKVLELGNLPVILILYVKLSPLTSRQACEVLERRESIW